MYGHWIPPEEFNPIDYIGFIYKIISPTGQFYIGRKMFWSTITKPPLKGSKRKRKITKESDWKTYTSSSREMNELIALHGVEKFKFEIIQLCSSKSELSYFETHWIIMSGSMLTENGLNFNASKIPCKPKTKKLDK